ncbi:MAG: hypothetical protein R3F58_05205 [Steroidobacteraceae bacterium]
MITNEQIRMAQRCLLAVLISGLPVAAYTQTAADTARLAAASSYLETGGLRIGMTLKDLGPATRALNPLLKVTNTEMVTVWPYDRNDTTKTAPPNSPQSVQSLQMQTIAAATRTTNESVNATLAAYPNPPVVTRLNRVISYPDGAGPNHAQVLDALRAKYGQATVTNVFSESASGSMMLLYWYFDTDGKLLPPSAPSSLPPCDADMRMCTGRSMFSLLISASGNGLVKSMDYKIVNGPLVISADLATDAYLQSVEDARTTQQTNDSKNRPLPKL